jgi:allantoate deiminase
MTDIGLTTWQDEVGNQWGRLLAAKDTDDRLVIGSHLDTVPNAGRYDGILGVLLGIEIANHFKSQQEALPFHIDIVGFGDEEGTRFGTTLIGSKALAGEFDPSWLSIKDASGVSMGEALNQFGLSVDQLSTASLAEKPPVAYLEVHIEQGPVLEAKNLSIGVVTGIAGAKRANVTFVGQAGHAGTTPMNLRQDALVAAAEFVVSVEALALGKVAGEVATVGQISAKPGATNVIAGAATVSLDIRALNDSLRDKLIDEIMSSANAIGSRRNVNVQFEWTHQAPAVLCDSEIQNHMKVAAELSGIPEISLPSGAGHDAMAVANICPVGMLFVRSPRGLSHHPEEAVIEQDVQDALTVMIETVRQFAQKD